MFRESITGENLRNLGYDPEEYTLEIPLSNRLTVQRSYVRAGEEGMFSTGLTEHGTDLLRFTLNPRGTLELTQDAALTTLHGRALNASHKRSATFTQGFGKGTTAGTFSLLHTDTRASTWGFGVTRLESDSARLDLGLAKSLSLTAGLERMENLVQLPSTTHKIDIALTRPTTGLVWAEYHKTRSTVGTTTTDLTQMVFRTPEIELGDVATLSASHLTTESSVTGTENTSTMSLAANPTDSVTVTASHGVTDRESAADTAVTAVGSQIKLRPDLAIGAAYSNTDTEGSGVAVQRSYVVTRTPTDNTGLGFEASYTELDATSVTVEPTVDVKLTYATSENLQLSGTYHDNNARPSPGLGAMLKFPLLGGTVGLAYDEYSFDSATNAVLMTRSYKGEVSRPLAWGLDGRLGYYRTDNLADPTVCDRIIIGLAGENRVFGKMDMQYESAKLRGPSATLPNGSSLTLSLARSIGIGELTLSGKRTLAAGSLEPDHQIQLDLKASW
ncbi:MAG: hypothetical protein ACUVX8_14600 [Candidatus Zipacnadales bacterium]